jgi:hypothetical protein
MTSGVTSGDVKWYKSSSGAGSNAVLKLFNTDLVHKTMNQTDYCNCLHVDEPVGKCMIRGTVCGMFNTTQDVESAKVRLPSFSDTLFLLLRCCFLFARQPSYQAWAEDLANGHAGHVTKYADPNASGKCNFTTRACSNLPPVHMSMRSDRGGMLINANCPIVCNISTTTGVGAFLALLTAYPAEANCTSE